MQEAQKNQMKHEEEVQLRLFFESKLNTLHHLNRELTSKVKSTFLTYNSVQTHEDESRRGVY